MVLLCFGFCYVKNRIPLKVVAPCPQDKTNVRSKASRQRVGDRRMKRAWTFDGAAESTDQLDDFLSLYFLMRK